MALHNKTYIKRPEYVQNALKFLDKNLIKVFTGMRRTGKSYLMLQIMDEIQRKSPGANIIFIDKELTKFDFIKTANDLRKLVDEEMKLDRKNYLFIDEVQEIDEFEKVLRSLLNEGNTDIWCTGSNAKILSGELADRLSGRYIEFHVHSLSYLEFLQFHSLENNNENLSKYLKFGGLPNLINLPLEEEVAYDYLTTINATVLLKDVIKRHQIRNVAMLENLLKFLADNTGSIFSAGSISKFLKSQGQKISPLIISNYLSYILDSYHLIKVPRIDIQGKRFFEINEKYYFEDIGLRNAWIGYQPMHINKLIENVVFRYLLENGYKVAVGKLVDKEIDFVAEKSGNKLYVQCAYLMPDEKIRKREFGNLLKIKDNHRKIVVSMDEPYGGNVQGIEHIHLRLFLSTKL
jgi:predicted AAA+ superfamily ATPase